MIKPLFLSAAAAALALAIGPASAQSQPQSQQSLAQPGSSFTPKENPGNWSATVARTERGHLIGNPEAETRLIEFISYTCPHCSDFAARGEPPLEIVLLQPGKITLEVRPVIRNGIDLAVTLLAQCGDPAQFKARHQMLMLNQAIWLGKARNAPASQQEIWQRGDKAARMNAVNALGLTAMLAARGQSTAELDACVSNDAAAKALLANDEADAKEYGVSSTPSFALDGKLLADVHGWEALYPVLSARFAAAPPHDASTGTR
jgi:protein-disulfide isomerase